MSSDDWIGRKVYHSIFGYGKVLAYRPRYKEAQVKFEDLTLWVSIEELQKVVPAEDSGSKLIFEKDKPETELPQEKARKIIEALRLGIVPECEIEEFTIHRNKELEQIENGFKKVEAKGGHSVIILGEYGTGKSHFLDLISVIALKKKYVVAKTEIDIYEKRPHRPKRIYSSLMGNIRWELNSYPNTLTNFLKLALQDESAIKILKQHIFFAPLVETIGNKKGIEDIDLLADFLEGKDGIRVDMVRNYYKNQKLQALYDSVYASDLYCYILTGVSCLAKAMGFKGLVILIDEGESVFNVNKSDRDKADNFFKGLLFACVGKKYRSNDLFHSFSRRSFPYCFSFPSNLFVVLAMTPRFEDYEEPIWYKDTQKIELSSIDEDDMQKIFDKLLKIYKIAYPTVQFNNIDDLKTILMEIWIKFEYGKIEFRQVIKSIIYALDFKRHYPQRKLLFNNKRIESFL
jgi:hypothetical protein